MLDEARALFGDERDDYAAALKRNYEKGPPSDWPEHFISTYASCHPSEDFAECWAHYFHIVDTLESARAFGLSIDQRPIRIWKRKCVLIHTGHPLLNNSLTRGCRSASH